MRCPDCNKFVSYDTDQDPETNITEHAEVGTFDGDVRIVNQCAECSTDLVETTFSVDVDLSDEVQTHKDEVDADRKAKKLPPVEHELELSYEIARNDRQEMVDKKGKPIAMRFRRTFYGASGTFEIRCGCGQGKAANNEPIAVSDWDDECQASGMDEC